MRQEEAKIQPEASTESSFEERKLQLEVDKLAHEIDELKKAWYRKPSNIAPLSSIVVAVFAVLYGYYSGLFNNQTILLENRKHDLEAEIRKFVADSSRLSSSRDSALKENTRLKTSINNYAIQLELLRLQLKLKGNTKLRYDSLKVNIDSRGNVTSTIAGDDSTIYRYNAEDKLIYQSRNGMLTTFTYDAAGKVTSVTNPQGMVTTYQYDSSGNLEGYMDQLGKFHRVK